MFQPNNPPNGAEFNNNEYTKMPVMISGLKSQFLFERILDLVLLRLHRLFGGSSLASPMGSEGLRYFALVGPNGPIESVHARESSRRSSSTLVI